MFAELSDHMRLPVSVEHSLTPAPSRRTSIISPFSDEKFALSKFIERTTNDSPRLDLINKGVPSSVASSGNSDFLKNYAEICSPSSPLLFKGHQIGRQEGTTVILRETTRVLFFVFVRSAGRTSRCQAKKRQTPPPG